MIFVWISSSYSIANVQKDCNNISGDKERLYCLEANLKISDIHLNDSYQKMRKIFDQDKTKALKDIQLSWLDYRDKDCRLKALAYSGGTLEAEVETRCVINKNIVRTEELNHLIDAWDM